MNAGSAKVYAVNASLVIQILELLHKLNKSWMTFLKLGTGNASLSEDSDTAYKLAVILPIFVREHCTEKSRA